MNCTPADYMLASNLSSHVKLHVQRMHHRAALSVFPYLITRMHEGVCRVFHDPGVVHTASTCDGLIILYSYEMRPIVLLCVNLIRSCTVV